MLKTIYSLPKGYRHVHTFIPLPLPLHPHLYTLTFTPLPLYPHLYTLIPTTTIEPIEKEWAVRIRKYRYRINADKAIKDELREFIEIIIYKIQDLTDNDL